MDEAKSPAEHVAEPVDLVAEARSRRSLPGRVWREVRDHPMAYSVTLVFAVAGAVLTPLILPAASPWLGAIGGFAFGVYAAMCAVPDKFLGS